MKLLFFQWNAFMQRGIENAMKRQKIAYDTYHYIFADWDKDDVFVDNFSQKIRDGGYDTVFSVNFSPLIAQVCNALSVRYVSWVYDCPLHIRRTESLSYPCNEVYFFDQAQTEEYQRQGIKTVHHLPLAVDTQLFAAAGPDGQNGMACGANAAYDCDVSLLGQLYRSEFGYLCSPLKDYQRGYLEGIVRAQVQLSGGYLLRELVTDELTGQLNEVYDRVSGGKFQVQPAELEYTLACEATGRARFMALALLQNRCRVRLYSNDTHPGLKQVRHMGYVNYYTQMPQVFRGSRINLNCSLCAIRTGIPLRILDIIGCGGFVLTNYQAELPEYFQPDRDIVIYEDMKDLVAKTQYYLAHEAERKEITARGLRIIKEAFSFDDRIGKMLL